MPALGDSYYRVYKALHLVTREAIPCIDNALRVWHSAKQNTLPPCTGNCPDGKKPKRPASCQNCIDWGAAVESVFYQPPPTNPPQPPPTNPPQPPPTNPTQPPPTNPPQPPPTNPPQPPPINPPQPPPTNPPQPPPTQAQKTQITWSNVSQSNLGKSHVELAKTFILRLPKVHPPATWTSVSDFDSASVLMIMTRFREFHQGDRSSYDAINKISQIRNDLSHMGLKDDMCLKESKVVEYFQDIEAFVTCLETLHPQHFTSGQIVRSRLSEIQLEPVTAKMKEEIHLNLRLELQSISQKMADLEQIVTKQITAYAHSADDLNLCQKQLKANYRTIRGGIGFIPGVPKEFPIDNYFVELTLVMDRQTPTQVQYKPLKGYADVLTLTDENGRRLDHVLVRGEAGTGKSTMVDKLAYQWATDLREPSQSDDTPNPLSRFQFVFALDIRRFGPDERDITDCIHSQLLPRISTETIKSLLTANADKCLFLLDGFDELKSQHHALKSNQLLGSYVVVTTRPDKVKNFCECNNGYVHVRLDGFSEKSRETFVNKYFDTAPIEQQESPNTSEGLLIKLEESYMNPLSCYPLLLAMICVIWHRTGEIPVRMTNLYKQAVDIFALQFYTKDSTIKALSSQKNKEVNEVLVMLGSTALDGLLLKDKQLIFEKEAFTKPGRIQCTSNQTGLALACGLVYACVGLEVGLRVGSLGLGLVLAIFGLSLGVGMFSFKINHVADAICHALKLGLLIKVRGSSGDSQYSFYHKTMQEFCAAKYWASLAESDRKRFEYYLGHIDKANVDNMQYLLRFCCGFSSEAAAIILHHTVNNCGLDWKLPVTLLFEAESDSHIHSNLHSILRPVTSLSIHDYLSSELWSILKHYCCQRVQTWLTHIVDFDALFLFADPPVYDFLADATKSSTFNCSLKSVRLHVINGNVEAPIVYNFLVQQTKVSCLVIMGPAYAAAAASAAALAAINGILTLLLHKPIPICTTGATDTDNMTYFDIVIPNMTILQIDAMSIDNCKRLLDIIIHAGKKADCLPMRELYIRLMSNSSDRIGDKFAEALSYMSGLTSLVLHIHTNVLDKHSMMAICKSISKMSNLMVLKLRNWTAYIDISTEELCQMLPLGDIPKLRKLDLSALRIGLQGATALSESLCHIPLLTHLKVTLMNSDSVIALSQGLHHIPLLTKLDLPNCDVEVKGATALSASLCRIPLLTHLKVTLMDSDSVIALSQGLLHHVPQLTRLDLPYCKVTVKGAAALSASLCHIPLLTDLDVTLIDGDSVIALSQGLHHIPQLTKLHIDCSRNISVEATEAILKKLLDLPNLTELWIPDLETNQSEINSNIVKECVSHIFNEFNRYNEREIQNIVSIVKRFT